MVGTQGRKGACPSHCCPTLLLLHPASPWRVPLPLPDLISVPGYLDASPSPTVCPQFSLLLCLSLLLCRLVFLSFCVSVSLQQNRS